MISGLLNTLINYFYYRNKLVEDALGISLNYLRGNYVRVTRKLKEMPVLLSLTGCLHLPKLRKNMLKIMSVAYSSSNLAFPSEKLVDWMLYKNPQDVKEECNYYEIRTNEDSIYFMKNSFKEKQPVSCNQSFWIFSI